VDQVHCGGRLCPGVLGNSVTWAAAAAIIGPQEEHSEPGTRGVANRQSGQPDGLPGPTSDVMPGLPDLPRVGPECRV